MENEYKQSKTSDDHSPDYKSGIDTVAGMVRMMSYGLAMCYLTLMSHTYYVKIDHPRIFTSHTFIVLELLKFIYVFGIIVY